MHFDPLQHAVYPDARRITACQPYITRFSGYRKPQAVQEPGSETVGRPPTASKQYGRQPSPRRVVIESDTHQRHWLHNAQAVGQGPAQQRGVA